MTRSSEGRRAYYNKAGHDLQCDWLNRGLPCNCGVPAGHPASWVDQQREKVADRAEVIQGDVPDPRTRESSGAFTFNHAQHGYRNCVECDRPLRNGEHVVRSGPTDPDPDLYAHALRGCATRYDAQTAAPLRVTIDTPVFRRGFMALIARDGNGTTLLTADEARTLARRLNAAARELER